MVGETISHYRILEKLGEGGMGEVYKAEDLVLHRTVALKFPPDPMHKDEAVRERLLNEARMAATLSHQNVTAVHSVGDHEGRPFIVMEYVDGKTLRNAIDGRGPLPLEQFVKIAAQLCEGLNAVHEHEVLHRDIKTENILLTERDQVKIVDCGLAARFISAEGLEEELGIAGTSAYMSPEQMRGDPLDQRSDIFSVGVVFFEMLTGHLPFEADHPAALVYLLLNTDPPPMEKYRKEIPDEIAAVVRRALEKEPAKRYQSADEMIKDLRAIRV